MNSSHQYFSDRNSIVRQPFPGYTVETKTKDLGFEAIGGPFVRRLTLSILISGMLVTASAATLTHNYDLTSSLNDTLWGPPLVSDGGTLSASGYTFGANQGLSLSSALTDAGNYSILMDFSFSTLTGYRKILDFK